MGNNEVELAKTKNDYEIQKMAAQHNLTLGLEEIRRLREKDSKDFEIKLKELLVKQDEVSNKHEEETNKINNSHLEKMKNLSDIQARELDKNNKQFIIEKGKLENERKKNEGERQDRKEQHEEKMAEIKGQNERILEQMKNEQTDKNNHFKLEFEENVKNKEREFKQMEMLI